MRLDIKKSEAYKKLVQDMLDRYPKYDFTNPENNTDPLYAPYVDGEYICKEINFYTYWQGLGYADRTPKIKYLFVGQDNGGGRLFDGSESTKEFIDRIKKMSDGDRSIPYIDDETNESETDKNLVYIFEDFGYDLHQRYDELFFTNFCLSCRRDTEVGMHKEWMQKDADLFKRLYNILEPENIITMGMRTFECVYHALTGKDYLGLDGFDDFKEIVSSHEEIFIKRGKKSVPIYPIHHCGKHGIENLIADPLSSLRRRMKKIKGVRKSSPFAEYLFKLIDEYKLKNNGEYPAFNLEMKYSAKILSDLRHGKIHSPTKINVIRIIFIMKLSIDEAYALLAKANYTCSKYRIPKDELSKNLEDDKIDRSRCSKNYDELKFDGICIRYIDKQNFDRNDIDEELDDNFLNCIFSNK